MEKLFLSFMTVLFLVSANIYTQDDQKTTTLEEAIKAACPNISEKDLKSLANSLSCDEPYGLGVDSKKQDSVPEGTITKYHWVNKTIYVGTQRDYWLYVPKQYTSSKPACLMIFQDGQSYLEPDVQANIVFDNLIYNGDIPVIIGLFISPGDKGPGDPGFGGTDNRSVEYNSVSDLYPRFLIEEIIPEIKKNYNITDDPAGRALVGHSSGGICAFNAAWQRPDAFEKVISHCGAFVNILGGDKFPEMIRKSVMKPIRVFLQSGERDLDLYFGNLPIRNKDMAAALEYSGYDYKFVFGEGGHTLMHGGAIFPNTLRWLWRDYPKK
jgi:enterochelin esterase-like enzyme